MCAKTSKSKITQKKSSASLGGKTSKKKHAIVNVTQPKHRLFTKGVALSWRSSFNLLLRPTGNGEVSDKALEAFRKSVKHKKLRRRFVFRAAKAYELVTKKPNEVRMGKGRGTKVSRRIFPFVAGQGLVEVNLFRRIRATQVAKIAMQKAARKLPFRTRVLVMDI